MLENLIITHTTAAHHYCSPVIIHHWNINKHSSSASLAVVVVFRPDLTWPDYDWLFLGATASWSVCLKWDTSSCTSTIAASNATAYDPSVSSTSTCMKHYKGRGMDIACSTTCCRYLTRVELYPYKGKGLLPFIRGIMFYVKIEYMFYRTFSLTVFM